MITHAFYLGLKGKQRRFWQLTARERKQLDVYEFLQNRPEKAVVYVRREVIPGSIATRKVTVTTIDGAILGYGYLRVPYKHRGHLWYPLEFKANNGVAYQGTYYASRDYANVRRVT